MNTRSSLPYSQGFSCGADRLFGMASSGSTAHAGTKKPPGVKAGRLEGVSLDEAQLASAATGSSESAPKGRLMRTFL